MSVAENRLNQTANQLFRVEKFIRALGDARDWAHNGEVYDAGKSSDAKCICEHPIRYCYVIENTKTGVKTHVGSECINNFQECNPPLYEALKQAEARYKEQVKEERAKFKAAQDAAANSTAKAAWDAARALGKRIVALRKEAQANSYNYYLRNTLPDCFYWLERETRRIKEFKTVKGLTKFYESQTKTIERFIADIEATEAYAHYVAKAREGVKPKGQAQDFCSRS